MYVLDTDTATHLLQDDPRILTKMEQIAALQEDVVFTIITKIEILQGRMTAVLKADTHERFLTAQQRLIADEQSIRRMSLLFLDTQALDVFKTLLAIKGLKKIGRADLLIASIARANNATPVTRNLKHFKLVPQLKLANWVD